MCSSQSDINAVVVVAAAAVVIAGGFYQSLDYPAINSQVVQLTNHQ